MGWVSQSSYIFGWGNGGDSGPGYVTPPLPFKAEKDEDEDGEE